MRILIKILLLFCVVAGFVSLTQAFKGQEELPKNESVTDITLSSGEIII